MKRRQWIRKEDLELQKALDRFPSIVRQKKKRYEDRQRFLERTFGDLVRQLRREEGRRKPAPLRIEPDAQKHPWRLCPAGHHYRKEARVVPFTRTDGTPVRGHE